MKRPPTRKELLLQVDRFNAAYPVGQRVNVQLDNGTSLATKTRSKAEILSGHSAVIWLDGIGGCYMLNRVTPVKESE